MALPEYWEHATQELSARDAVLCALAARCEGLALGSRGDAFSTLARAIVGQQISVKAAQSVWARLVAELTVVTPAAIGAADLEQLRRCGLSAQKSGYLLDLAMRFRSGLLDPRRWPLLDDETLIRELTQVKGIGRWTAEMFLIFHLARPDVLPLDDLGLQRAMRLNYNRGRPLTRSRMERIARPWAPWRSVATWYLWRSLDPVPLQY
jgi:DNA-3-methyladenine glycosylase II